METIRLKTCTMNTIGNLAGFAYVKQHGGLEIIALRSDLEIAAYGEDEVARVTGVAHDSETGVPGWANATTVEEGKTVWAAGSLATASVEVSRQDIREALIMSVCHDIVGLAERAMDCGGEYEARMEGLGNARGILRWLTAIAPKQMTGQG